MDKFIENILKVDKIICSNIEKREVICDDGLLAQNIISQLRNFVEAIIIKIYSENHEVDFDHAGTKRAVKYIKACDDLRFLQIFHRRLQVTSSHLVSEPEASLRLMWRYYDSLLDCKELLKCRYNLEVLNNIDEFPQEDDSLAEYYEKIVLALNKHPLVTITESPTNRFYIHKKKPFRVDGKRYYELTLSEADDKTSKFDRFIAFTKCNIPTYYATHLQFVDAKIDILNREMPIRIIIGFKVSVRPCEFNNFFKLLGLSTDIKTADKEYAALMRYLTAKGRNLTEFLELDQEDFERISKQIYEKEKLSHIFSGISKCREMKGQPGYNILTYLLYHLNNKVIKAQYDFSQNRYLSFLYLKYESIPFDEMPFANNPAVYNAKLLDVFDCINIEGREHELLGRKIKTNTEMKAQLYTPISELSQFKNIPELIARYNRKLYHKHVKNSSLILENGYVFISGYENDTVTIINKLLDLSKSGDLSFEEFAEEWMNTIRIENSTVAQQVLDSVKIDW